MHVRYFIYNCIKAGLPVKGAIAYGDLFLDVENNIFLGQPLIDAHLIEEDLQYMGVVVHHSMEKYIDGISEEGYTNLAEEMSSKYSLSTRNLYFKHTFKEVLTPFRKKKLNHLNMDYLYVPSAFAKDYSEFTNHYKLTMSGEARKYIDNTKEVFDQFISQNKELKALESGKLTMDIRKNKKSSFPL